MRAVAVPVSEMASELGLAWSGSDVVVVSAASLGRAAHGDLTFATSAKPDAVQRALDGGAVVIVADATGIVPGTGAIVEAPRPRSAFARALNRYFDAAPEPGIAPTARVHPTAVIDPTASVGEYTVVRAGARIGERCEIRDHVVIAENVVIGSDVLVKSHAVIGEEGFGMETDDDGDTIRIPHLGSVEIDDHVEIGSHTTVCRGTMDSTRIGHHTKIDDHVHVAHNCVIGSNVIITACAELSGSVQVEDGAWLGPNSSVREKVTIGRGALVGIGAVVTKSVTAGDVTFGNPARRIRSRDAG